MNDWILIIGIWIVMLPFIIMGLIATWREHKMKKIGK
jgi:hypothetical protein